jgi:DNA-binding beta-propeller fold protein YncE
LRVEQTIPVGHQPGSLALSQDGRLYVGNNGAGDDDGGVSVIDTTAKPKRVIHEIKTGWPVRDLAITPDGRKLYLALEKGGLAKFEIANDSDPSWHLVSPILCPEGVAITPDGNRLYVSYQCTGPGGSLGHDAIGIFDVKEDELVDVVKATNERPLPNVGGAINVSPDGQYVWVNGTNACIAENYDHEGCPFVPGGVINVIETKSKTLVKTLGIPPEYGTGLISFAQDGALAIVGGNCSKFIDTHTFLPTRLMDVPLSGSTAFGRDRALLYAPVPAQNRVVLLEFS